MAMNAVRTIAGTAVAAALAAVVACSPTAPDKAPEKVSQVAAKTAGCSEPVAGTGKYMEVTCPGSAHDSTTAFRVDTVQVPLAAVNDPEKGDQIEYMVEMKAGDTLTYSWTAGGADDFWHEFHGHTADTVTFHKKAAGTEHRGVLVAPFDGIHGWYFENRTANRVVVNIRMGGFYKLAPAKAP